MVCSSQNSLGIEQELTSMFSRYGAVYLLLQLVPVLSMLFLLTAAVSSALWAADLETRRRQQETRVIQAPEYADGPAGDTV